jgi:hypothetical protein
MDTTEGNGSGSTTQIEACEKRAIHTTAKIDTLTLYRMVRSFFTFDSGEEDKKN